VADQLRTHTPPRARPIADLSSEAALARADELARRWVIALIRTRPLDRIGDVPFEDLAREAPSLCAQALRAVQSDVELERLTGRGAPSGREESAAARRLAVICGAREPAAVVEAVEALRGVLWEALLDQLTEPSPRLVGDVCDRLACVCAATLAAAVEAMAVAVAAEVDGGDIESELSTTSRREVAQASSPPGEAVIVDERAHVTAAPPAGEGRSSDEGRSSGVAERRPSWGESGTVASGVAAVEIEIRDERGEQGPAAWITSIGAQLERFGRDSSPFAVLLVELLEIERLRRQELAEELSRLAGGMEQALTAALGAWSGSLTRERPGRCWLLVPETDRAGVERLAERLTLAVAARASGHRTLLAVAIGTAVCPEDGREAAALAAHADVGLYAARSAARASVARSAAPVDESA
jgi:hypothetical protein